LRGRAGTQFARIQTDVYVETNGSDPYGASTELMEDIEAALGPVEPFAIEGGSPGDTLKIAGAFPQGRSPLFELDELTQIRMTQDFFVWYGRA
jgi:hypothetical protein